MNEEFLLEDLSYMIPKSHDSNIVFSYKNVDIVRNDPMFYLIIGYTYSQYVEKQSIVFQMEPWVYDINKNWGVKTWQSWAIPDSTKFLYVLRHINELNPAQWFTSVPKEINYDKRNKIIAILSNKTHDTGHINRINFVKFVELQGYDIIDTYGRENYHNIKNYKGPVQDKSIINEYKYMLSAENNNEYNYATEKIWEAFINNVLCFYDGCPNLTDYVSQLSFIPVDLTNQAQSLQIILHAIENNLWQQRLDHIIKAKELTINEYNLFEKLYKILNKK